MFGAGVQRGMTIAGLGDDADAAVLGEQFAQARARQRFVVGDDHLHAANLARGVGCIVILLSRKPAPRVRNDSSRHATAAVMRARGPKV